MEPKVSGNNNLETRNRHKKVVFMLCITCNVTFSICAQFKHFLLLHTIIFTFSILKISIIYFIFLETYRDDRASRFSHLSTFSSHFTVIIGENLLASFFSFIFKPKILQSFVSSQLTTWFHYNSQKTSMPIIFWF